MNIFQAKIIPLVIGAFALTGCEAIRFTFELLEFLEIIVELCRSIRDYPRFWIPFLIVVSGIIGFWYIFYGRKYYREVERKLDRLNGEKCPYCGKRKKGMADHIAAMHSEHSEGESK